MTAPTPDLVRVVRAGCKADGWSSCRYPDCHCWRFTKAVCAALVELTEPSEEMLDAAEVHPELRTLVAESWRVMMRRVRGDEPQ